MRIWNFCFDFEMAENIRFSIETGHFHFKIAIFARKFYFLHILIALFKCSQSLNMTEKYTRLENVPKMTTWWCIIPRVFWVSLVWLDNRPLFGSFLILTRYPLLPTFTTIHCVAIMNLQNLEKVLNLRQLIEPLFIPIHDYSGTYNESLFIYKLNYKQIAWNCLKLACSSCFSTSQHLSINDFNPYRL